METTPFTVCLEECLSSSFEEAAVLVLGIQERRTALKPTLEDLFIGPLALPSFSQGFRWEDSRRRVRVVFAGVTIADSKHVMLLHEFGRLPVFYFPQEDVRMDLLEASEHCTHSPLKGEASNWTVRVGDRSAEHAAWSYQQPLPEGPEIQDIWRFTGI